MHVSSQNRCKGCQDSAIASRDSSQSQVHQTVFLSSCRPGYIGVICTHLNLCDAIDFAVQRATQVPIMAPARLSVLCFNVLTRVSSLCPCFCYNDSTQRLHVPVDCLSGINTGSSAGSSFCRRETYRSWSSLPVSMKVCIKTRSVSKCNAHFSLTGHEPCMLGSTSSSQRCS